MRMTFVVALLVCAAAAFSGLFAVSASATPFEFPSSSSDVVSSGGAPAGSVGYFWSKARGDKVSETFTGPTYVDHVRMYLQPGSNALVAGQTTDWTVSINGVDVGAFSVPPGTTSPFVFDRLFAPIAGPSLAVEMRMTNEVPSGGGSISFISTGRDRLELD